MTLLEFVIRLVFVFIYGSAIGLERQLRQRMAGLRTNALVTIGFALLVMLSVMTTNESSPTRCSSTGRVWNRLSGAGVIKSCKFRGWDYLSKPENRYRGYFSSYFSGSIMAYCRMSKAQT